MISPTDSAASRHVPPASSPAAEHRMKHQRGRDTRPEKLIRSILFRRGLRYRIDSPVLPGTRRRADIVFPKARVAVFVDGCFWHGCPEHGTWPKASAEWWKQKIESNQHRDRDTTARLEAAGWRVIRIWEHDEPAQAADLIATIVKSDCLSRGTPP